MQPSSSETTADRASVGAALILVGAIAYGLLSTVIRIAYAKGFTPSQVVGSQMAFGCVGLWLLALGLRALRPIGARAALALVASGIPIGLTGALYYGAVHALGSASLAIVLLFQFTWMGVLVDAALARRAPTTDAYVSLVLLLLGTVLATGVLEGRLGSVPLRGLALGVGSAVSYTAVIFASGRVEPAVDAWHRSALLGTGSMLAAFALHPPTFLFDGSLTRGLLGPSLATALLGPIVPTVCFAIGVPRIGPASASVVGAAELPAAMIAARLVLDEPISDLEWLGMLVIVVGIAWPRWRAARA